MLASAVRLARTLGPTPTPSLGRLVRFGIQFSNQQKLAVACPHTGTLKLGHGSAYLTARKCRPLTRFTHRAQVASSGSIAFCMFSAPRLQPSAGSASSAGSLGARQGPRATAPLHHRSAGGGLRFWRTPKVMQGQRRSVGPNRSFNPRPATASLARPGGAIASTIVAARPYKARLRGRG